MNTLKSMQELQKDSYLSGENDRYLENLYETYLKTPNEIAPEWQRYFHDLSQGNSDISHADIREYFSKLARQTSRTAYTQAVDSEHQHKQEKVIDLISAYRSLGHLQANIDPLGLYQGIQNATLELSYYGFTESDLNR